MDNEADTNAGRLIFWQAFGEEALKVLSPEQRQAILKSIFPAVHRRSAGPVLSAASQAYAAVNRMR